jgi:lysophospholipase L1-like esterase
MVRGLALLIAAAWLASPALAEPRWVGSWATSQQIPEERNALAAHDLDDATLRQTVHLSLTGAPLRLRLSNAFGTGQDDVTIPPGAEYVSDPATLTGADIAITLYFDTAPAQQTSHPGSRTTSYLLHGDHVSDLALPGAKTFDHWFSIAGIDVQSPRGAAIVALGDSITDGRGSTTNANDRWTDALAQRLAAAKLGVGVVNRGIGGGRVLLDGLGPNAMSRFDRDVLAQPGARWLIVFEAINDIGTFDPDGSKPKAAHDALVRQLTIAYEQMIAKAHDARIKVYGATVTPFMDCAPYHPKPVTEADRIAVNAWIRSHFDAVLDFDAAVRDPARPDHLSSAYDSGDGLHLSPAGYRALAAAIPLSLFQ